MKTPQIVLSPIGTNRPGIAIPGVSQIRGVLIDNPSGAWLLLRPTSDYIPPYTIGFARSFEGPLTHVDIEFPSSGPAGQVTTFAGDPPVIVLDTEPVGNSVGQSVGTAFIEQFTPNLTVTHLETVLIGDASGFEMLPSVANKRYRLVAYMFTMDSIGADGQSVSGALCSITSNDFNQNPLLYDHIGPKPENYGTGVQIVNIDFPVGVGITVTIEADWNDVDVTTTLIYQLI